MWLRLIADQDHGPLPALLVGLTALTGIVDAVSILALGRVFVANMTGNVVFAGFALAGAAAVTTASTAVASATDGPYPHHPHAGPLRSPTGPGPARQPFITRKAGQS